MKTTITEALQDIKTSLARIAKMRESVTQHLGRDARLRDPLEKDGMNSAEFVRRTRQAISDLEDKIVRIRSAIQAVNLQTTLTIEGTTRTVAAWLNWRREILPGKRQFLTTMANVIGTGRAAVMRVRQAQGGVNLEQPPQGDFIVNLNEVELAGEIERLELVDGILDGKLTLLNSTTEIEV